MSLHAHFQLVRPAFEAGPDPSFFFLGPGNEEAWATLRFVARSGGGGCLLLGESGTGKTLHALRLARDCRSKPVLWVDGLAPPAPRQFAAALHVPGHPEMPLRDALTGLRSAPLLIVDNASDLCETRWNELFHHLERLERRGARASMLALLDPQRTHALAVGLLGRLRNRCLRTVTLAPLDQAQTGHYVRQRLSHAGADGSAIFTEAALARVFTLSAGTPARIHILCENALIEAFSEARTHVSDEDVERAGAALRIGLGLAAVNPLPCADGDAAEDATAAAVAPAAPIAPPLTICMPAPAAWAEEPRIVRTGLHDGPRPLIELPPATPRNARLAPLRHSVKTIADVWNRIVETPARNPAREARRARRVPPLSVSAILETSAEDLTRRLEHAFTTNLSREGVAFIGERRLARSSNCTLWIMNRERRPTPLAARVARSRAVGPGAGLYEVGVELVQPLALSAFVPDRLHGLGGAAHA